jgi:hypothetical protein
MFGNLFKKLFGKRGSRAKMELPPEPERDERIQRMLPKPKERRHFTRREWLRRKARARLARTSRRANR